MRRDELADLGAFLAVAEEQSFTRAAARLATSQSALSHVVKRLETRMNVRLLTRTTRCVSLTEAGERLLRTLQPALNNIADEIASISEFSSKPAGTIRLTASEHATQTVLWPALKDVLKSHPDIHVEIAVTSSLVDIVAERFDAGVRLQDIIAKDMIAVPIGLPLRMIIVATPSYLAEHGTPQTLQELACHKCINIRLPTAGGLYAWELEKEHQMAHVRVKGQLTFNNVRMSYQAVMEGFGLAYLMEDQVADDIEAGRLVPVLEEWCPSFPGYYLYYPDRRQASTAFRVIVDALKQHLRAQQQRL